MGAGSPDPDERELLLELLRRDGFGLDEATPAPRSSRDPAPAGPAQRRFWIQEQVEASPGLNSLGCLLRFAAPLELPALERALAALVARHESLRTRFEEAAGEVLEIVGAPLPPTVERLDGGAGDERAVRMFVERPFRLEEAPLWRVARFADPADGDSLLLACHHAILDWTGAARLAQELAVLYAAELSGTTPALPEAPLQQADHAHWLRSEARRAQRDRDRAYWRARLAVPPPPLALAAARPAQELDGRRCRAVALELDEAQTAALRRFAAERRSTVFVVLLAAYAGVLGRFALAEEVGIGTAVANRDRPEAEAIVGCLMDMLPLRCDLSGEPGLGSLTKRLHAAVAEDLEHASLGFAELVELARPERRAGVPPLFQAIFNLLPAPTGEAAVQLTPIETRLARADLALELRDLGTRLVGRLEIRDGLLTPAQGEAVAEAFACLLRHGLADPERPLTRLPLLRAASAAELLDRINPPLPAPPSETLGDLFLAAAARSADEVALIQGSQSATFRELRERSTALAEELVARGLRPGRPVAVCLERSIELAVALLAVLRAGGVALPLDPGYPGARLAAVLEDSGATLLIAPSRPAWVPEGAGCSVVPPGPHRTRGLALPKPRAQDPAYLIYTSGSTGRPKGVTGLHRGAVNRLRWIWQAFPFEPGELCCQKTSPAFVDFVAELFGPLLAGVPSVIADAGTALDPRALTDLIRARRVSRIVLVPSLLRAWLDSLPDIGERLASLRLCVSSGEALPPELARRFREAVPACRLLNLYGSSEVSADVAWHEVDGCEGARMPLGRPIPGNRIAVVDAAGQPLPPGAPGEIRVQGFGVAGGYLGDPAATSARFGALESADPAAPWFLSGDLGFWDEEGRLFYLGRADRQVKVQGVRVEPGEIETVLAQHPEVRDCRLLARPGSLPGTTTLVAYLAGTPGLTHGQLRAFLATRLPQALIPEAFVILERLPLLPNGKLDVAALPPPEAGTAVAGRSAVLDPLAALVAESWASVLERPVTDAEADFFALGGSSLQAILAMARLGTALGRSLPVALLFETPRLGDLARRLGDSPEDDPLPSPLRATAEGPAPATSNQAWLWEEYCRDPQRVAYNLAIAYRLQGPLDTAALEAALGDLVARHEALRTRLAASKAGLLQVVEAAPAVELERHELTMAADLEAALQRLMETQSRRPFALDRDLPLRAGLARLGEQDHCLLLVLHHVAGDGWSGQLLVEELACLYRARRDGGAPPAVPRLQSSDVARWQELARPQLARRLESYRRSLEGAETPRPAGLRVTAASGGPVGLEAVPLEPVLLERLHELGRTAGATPFLAMLAAWAALLARFGDCEQPLLATPLSGRGTPGLESVVGFLANPVLLKVDLREAPAFDQVIRAARTALLEALRFQEVPFAWIQASGDGWPKERGDALRSMFVVEDLSAWDLTLPGVTARLLAAPASPEARVDLALVVTGRPEAPELRLEYAERRVPQILARRLARGLAALVAGAVASPATALDRLPLLGPEERPEPTAAARPTPACAEPAAQRLDALLWARAAADPEAPAAGDGQATLGYGELQQRAEAVARRLCALGVRPGDRVGLVAPASPRQLAGLSGIWRAGATAVPLDPAYPPARIAATLADAAAAAALVEQPLDVPCRQLSLEEAQAPDARPTVLPEGGDAAAALIYTSGTTGRPKGALVAQSALCRLGAALAERYGLRPGDRILQVVSPGFDVALSDIAMSFSAGATLVMPTRQAVMPGSALLATLRDATITHMQAPAAVLAATRPPADPAALPDLRVVAAGGEVCPPETARSWAAGRQLFLAYGPSETTVTAALAEYRADTPAGTLGQPFCGARLLVLDAAGEPLPIGVPGELYIGGPNVGLGYFGRPSLTAERFLSDPEGGPGARRYRTGDRARLEEDGTVTFLGRLDRQVKLRGFRIEPGETEAALRACAGVARALVTVRTDALGEGRLLAWVVAEPGAGLETAGLRQALQRVLPDHLVPSLIAEIAEVPLTANGKVDWAALPEPDAGRRPAAGGMPDRRAAPRTPGARQGPALRRELAALWSELLGRGEIGLDESFFDIGGHSLLVVRLQERLAEHFEIELPIGELFAHPTLRSLAARLEQALQSQPAAEAMEDFIL